MLVRGAVEEETNCTGGISEVDFSCNGITCESMDHLLKLHTKLLKKVGKVDLSLNFLNSESCATLNHLMPHMPPLKVTEIQQWRIGRDGVHYSACECCVHETTVQLVHNSTEIQLKKTRTSHTP